MGLGLRALRASAQESAEFRASKPRLIASGTSGSGFGGGGGAGVPRHRHGELSSLRSPHALRS